MVQPAAVVVAHTRILPLITGKTRKSPGKSRLTYELLSRPIRLEPWQQSLVDAATEEFIRGLIHSDGCRVVANDRGVRSVRYHFTNHSEDILGLFTGALDNLGIPWTRNSRYMTAVYRKAATARMDEFVGPKDAPRPAFLA